MKVTATPVKAKELRPGELFSMASQGYWDKRIADHADAIGEKVFIRTECPEPASQAEDMVNRIEISPKDSQ